MKKQYFLILFFLLGFTITAGRLNSTTAEFRFYPDYEPEITTPVQDTLTGNPALLALELLTGMKDNILDPDAPIILTVNLFSPFASDIHEQNRDREQGTKVREFQEVSTQIDGKQWWERLSILSAGAEAGSEKKIPYQILMETSQISLPLSEGGVSFCRVFIEPGILPERSTLSAVIAIEKDIIRSEKVEIRFQTGTLSAQQKLEAWISFLLASGQTEEALLKADELIKLNPESSAPYSYKSDVLEAVGDLKGAKENALKAIMLYGDQSPEEDPPFLYLEQLQRIQKKIREKK